MQVSRVLGIAAVFAVLLSAGVASAQTTANADADIVIAITVTEDTRLDFGRIIAGGVIATNVTVSPAGAISDDLGGATTVDGHAAASFTVSGTAGESVSFDAQNTDATITSGGDTMTVSNFLESATTATLDGSGDAVFTVGADLAVSNTQAQGAYTGTYTVTAAYN